MSCTVALRARVAPEVFRLDIFTAVVLATDCDGTLFCSVANSEGSHASSRSGSDDSHDCATHSGSPVVLSCLPARADVPRNVYRRRRDTCRALGHIGLSRLSATLRISPPRAKVAPREYVNSPPALRSASCEAAVCAGSRTAWLAGDVSPSPVSLDTASIGGSKIASVCALDRTPPKMSHAGNARKVNENRRQHALLVRGFSMSPRFPEIPIDPADLVVCEMFNADGDLYDEAERQREDKARDADDGLRDRPCLERLRHRHIEVLLDHPEARVVHVRKHECASTCG